MADRSLDEAVRRIVREELASLLEQEKPATVAVTDLDRARARAALRRLGVTPKGGAK